MASTMIVTTVFKEPCLGTGIAYEVGSYALATKCAMELFERLTGKIHTIEQERDFEMSGYLFLDKDQTLDGREVAIDLVMTEDNGQFM